MHKRKQILEYETEIESKYWLWSLEWGRYSEDNMEYEQEGGVLSSNFMEVTIPVVILSFASDAFFLQDFLPPEL